MVHRAKVYGRLRLIRIVLRASTFSVLKLIEIVILLVHYTSLLAAACFGMFVHHINVLNYFVCLRTTDESSVPEMRIRSKLLIKCDLKWCIHLSKRLFLSHFYPLPCGAGRTVARDGFDSSVIMPFI